MRTKIKKYQLEDYGRVFNFFRELYRECEKVPFWLPARWEYAEYLISPLHKGRNYLIDWKETIYLWEDNNGKIVGVLCSESPDENIFVHSKPDFTHIEEEMIIFAEDKIISEILQKPKIDIWCQEDNSYRESVLQSRGYKRQEVVEYLNWRDLSEDLPETELPSGYTLHNMVTEEALNLLHKIERLTGAFDSKPYPIEVYRTMQSGPSYRNEFDLYTTDLNGEVTSFCIIWYDEELNIAYFEPVGTVAEHRRKGLGRATLSAGLQTLKKAGVDKAYVGSYGNERMAFYNASGFNCRSAYHPWSKSTR